MAADVGVIIAVDILESTASDIAWPYGATVIAGSLRNRTAVAKWVLMQQEHKGERLSLAVIAIGEPGSGGSIRFSVEDQLGAGAIIDALADLGVDYCSPEAAVACAAFASLRSAIGHLVSASASGKKLASAGLALQVTAAAEVDATDVVPMIRE